MQKIENGCTLLIFYMMEDIKKVKEKNVFLHHFSVTDPPKIQYGHRTWALYRENAKRCNSSSNHDRN